MATGTRLKLAVLDVFDGYGEVLLAADVAKEVDGSAR
jgi:hypothetical protein